ncbi:hypothetical protein VNO77_21755 [Canavalia gladiata]|uniref:Uncharacterized protein n=1 Tax=Canavalia gladiata TaxID=3824 RepID=A0AAN9L1A5_CANGL
MKTSTSSPNRTGKGRIQVDSDIGGDYKRKGNNQRRITRASNRYRQSCYVVLFLSRVSYSRNASLKASERSILDTETISFGHDSGVLTHALRIARSKEKRYLERSWEEQFWEDTNLLFSSGRIKNKDRDEGGLFHILDLNLGFGETLSSKDPIGLRRSKA